MRGRHSVISMTDYVLHFADVVRAFSSIFNILAVLDNNQSIKRKPSFEWKTILSDKELQMMV